MFRYACTLFLGAFLLFQIQPLICKQILPWFGGTPAVWTTCMLFFQALLLGGYAYAHGSIGRMAPRGQACVHLLLLLATLVFLPVLPDVSWKPEGSESPTWRILALLGAHIGAPYLLLSATAPMLQAWYSLDRPAASPYRLYALSNAGSLLGLFSYPFAVEPYLTLRMQAYLWSGLYALFVLACGWCALRMYWRGGPLSAALPEHSVEAAVQSAASPAMEPGKPELSGQAPNRPTQALWLAWSACGSVLLLATTNQMTQDVAVVPFLWILPLGLYLLTFILCFDSARWYWRPLWISALSVALGASCAALYGGVHIGLWTQVALYSSALFLCCMVCHGELARLKPGPRYLTRFYLLLSAGGALGGCAVTLLAPVLCQGLWEYPCGLLACMLLSVRALYLDPGSRLYRGEPRWAWRGIAAVLVFFSFALALHAYGTFKFPIAVSRNFYGVLRVLAVPGKDEEHAGRVLFHGSIKHGFQFSHELRRRQPTTYYGLKSGIGIAERALFLRQAERSDRRGLRTGVVGLGTGTLAAYGRTNDSMRFYEINPEVVRLSAECFTFCKDTLARVEVILGDARISLEREQARGEPQGFDVLAIDAFSGDAIPLYLLTREAFALYWYHLAPDGILALHVTNHYLDLTPLIRGLAADCGKEAVFIESGKETENEVYFCRWVLVTGNRELLDSPALKPEIDAWPEDAPAPLVFTDDYSNLLKILKR